MSSKKTGKPTGCPPRYSDPAEMQKKIDEYFRACQGEFLRTKQGTIRINKFGDPIIINARPPTITGLALALGFASRQALLNYQVKGAFHDTITRAKARVESYAEGRLFDRDGQRGAEFSLTHNFRWGKDEPGGEGQELMKALLAVVSDD